MKKNDGLTDCLTRKSEKFEKYNPSEKALLFA